MKFQESAAISPGNDYFSFEVKNKAGHSFKLGVGICYDIRFSEFSLVYAREHAVDMLVFPGAFNSTTGELLFRLTCTFDGMQPI